MSEQRHKSAPLTPTRLEELALAYVARFATTQGKLRAYLQRKVHERGMVEPGGEGGEIMAASLIESLIEKFRDAGYVDDAAWARMKSGSLSRKGYGARRVAQALLQAGVEAETRASVSPGRGEQTEAAVALARRRRFGPFSRDQRDRQAQERQMAAMMRAGHGQGLARRVIEADDETALADWIASLREEEQDES